MKNIQIPDRNIFDEKAKVFSQTRFGKRLAEKYSPKPYEERRRGLYYFAWIASFFCNSVAIITGSTFVFSYALGLVAKLPEAMLLAGLFSGLILIGIETLKQLLVPNLFQDCFQYGWKASYYLRLIAICGLIAVSTGFNYYGGFDLVEVATTTPKLDTAILKNSDIVRNEYTPRIKEAERVAEKYRKSKLWNGRLSDDNAITYNNLIALKSKLENQFLAKLDSLEAFNDRATATVKQENQDKIKDHENKVKTKGRGLAGFSVACELLFILFCWYRERYEYKTATQYANIDDKETTTQNTGSHFNNGGLNGQNKKTEANGTAFPIGFYTEEQRMKQQNEDTENNNSLVFTRSYKKTAYTDTHTIEHNGRRYRLTDIERFYRTYRNRLQQSENSGDTDTAERRRKQLDYWENRRSELLEKINQASQG